MWRWGWVLWLVIGCGGPDDDRQEDPQPEPNSPDDSQPFGKGDDPHARPAPAVGIACDAPTTRTCDGDAPLRCVAGSGGAKWMADEPCMFGRTCVMDWGCLPVTRCTEVTLLNCVGQDLFACAELEDGSRGWQHVEECPAAIRCVDGLGCPNPYGLGEECSFVDPPRCTGTGLVIPCTLEGIDAVRGPPERCPSGQTCVRGHGCRDTDGENEDERPTTPPKGLD